MSLISALVRPRIWGPEDFSPVQLDLVDTAFDGGWYVPFKGLLLLIVVFGPKVHGRSCNHRHRVKQWGPRSV